MSAQNPDKRIMKELRDITNDPPAGITAKSVGEDLRHWVAAITGPAGSPYEGGIFYINIAFTKEYPFKPPRCSFITRVYHPNVSDRGGICLDLLKDQWSPALTVSKLLLSISSLMCEPNPDDPLVPEIARQFKSNIKKFNKTAADWTAQYASNNDDAFGIHIEAASASAAEKKSKSNKSKKSKKEKDKEKSKDKKKSKDKEKSKSKDKEKKKEKAKEKNEGGDEGGDEGDDTSSKAKGKAKSKDKDKSKDKSKAKDKDKSKDKTKAKDKEKKKASKRAVEYSYYSGDAEGGSPQAVTSAAAASDASGGNSSGSEKEPASAPPKKSAKAPAKKISRSDSDGGQDAASYSYESED